MLPTSDHPLIASLILYTNAAHT